ncbi:unnamed protein product [Timema podura]|uniref:Uncharacterized protein n=1 Tax=Timema podura TaxID=61482 RepID=A0ABN7NRT8_TIMPD|nr:unnamed protein product [Timema podura]
MKSDTLLLDHQVTNLIASCAWSQYTMPKDRLQELRASLPADYYRDSQVTLVVDTSINADEKSITVFLAKKLTRMLRKEFQVFNTPLDSILSKETSTYFLGTETGPSEEPGAQEPIQLMKGSIMFSYFYEGDGGENEPLCLGSLELSNLVYRHNRIEQLAKNCFPGKHSN